MPAIDTYALHENLIIANKHKNTNSQRDQNTALCTTSKHDPPPTAQAINVYRVETNKTNTHAYNAAGNYSYKRRGRHSTSQKYRSNTSQANIIWEACLCGGVRAEWHTNKVSGTDDFFIKKKCEYAH